MNATPEILSGRLSLEDLPTCSPLTQALVSKRMQGDLGDVMKMTVRGYIEGLFHEHLNRQVMKFGLKSALGLSPRLLLSVPPRHGKSETVGQGLSTWFLTRWPHLKVLYASHKAIPLAMQHVMKTRQNLEYLSRLKDERGRPLHPELRKKTGGMWGAMFFEIAGGGSMAGAGVGAGTAGIGGNICTLDDALGNRAQAESKKYLDGAFDFLQADIMTRVEGNGGVLVNATRWVEDDPIGRCKKDLTHEGWDEVIYPAFATGPDGLGRVLGEPLAPYLRDKDFLERMRLGVGSWVFEALYQCNPVSQAGGIFLREWIRHYETPPHLLVASGRVTEIRAFVDANFRATTDGSFFNVQVWGRDSASGGVYLLHSWRGRPSFTESCRVLLNLYNDWKCPIEVEARANGDSIVDVLKAKIPNIIAVEPRTIKDRKLVEAKSATAMWEAGQVYLPTDQNTMTWTSGEPGKSGLRAFTDEVFAFPKAPNDDQVDAMSAALKHYMQAASRMSADEYALLLDRLF